MQYPHGRCERCGERIWGNADGSYACLNCGAEYPETHFTDSDAGRSTPSAEN